MSDAIFVNGLVLHAYHGVMQHEAKVGQTFKLDLVLDIDLAEASRTDKLKHTVSYDHGGEDGERGVLRRAAIAWSKPRPAPSPMPCSTRFPQVRSIRVTVHKPHAPIAATFDDVGVIIERARRSRPWHDADMAEAFIALGGNVGDVRQTFDRAIAMLCDGAVVRLIARSSDYRTPPWGVTDQPPFVNAVIAVATALPPHALFARAHGVRARARPRPHARAPLGTAHHRHRSPGL